MKRFLIGIDGGVNTGVAQWDRKQQKLLRVSTMTFWEAFDWIVTEQIPEVTEIMIEAPQKIRPTFDHGASARKIREKIAGNVGGVKRESALLAEGLRRRGFTVTEVKPDSAKWDVKYFQQITKWKDRTSQHGRDAVKLVFGY